MTSPQHPAAMENLPEELLSNIFIRLLAKQLAQMRSVSKSWNALLSESSFVKSHLHHSINNKGQNLLLFYHTSSSDDDKRFTALPYRSPDLKLTNFIKLPPVKPLSGSKDIEIIGSINGLICSCYSDLVIQIWNPSLSAVLTLPPNSMPSQGYDSINVYTRFGFDPKADDYKVVKFTGLRPTGSFVEWQVQTEIYSMRKGTWELIPERFPSHITLINNGDHVCLDGHGGHLHWICYNCIKDNIDLQSERILAFDLGSETFREIPLPHSILDYKNVCSNALGALAGNLCVVSWLGDGTCEVWVMDEYGVAKSWVKCHVISLSNYHTCPYGFTSHNEFLLHDYSNNLVLYDPVANKTKIFENHLSGEGWADKIVEYVDSLVWVIPAKHDAAQS